MHLIDWISHVSWDLRGRSKEGKKDDHGVMKWIECYNILYI